MNRIDRLTAMLIHLQTKRIVKAEELAGRFEISLRTVYRDVRALMEAGVPLGAEPGKGYFIVEGYHLPPVMFNQAEASALLTAGKLVDKMTDASIRKAYQSALHKIKAVLNASEKDHLENLQSAVVFLRSDEPEAELPGGFMADIQRGISSRLVLKLEYHSSQKQERTTREVEPIGIVHYAGRWHLIGWCRLRRGYRDFRMDLIQTLSATGEHFDTRQRVTLQQYLDALTKTHDDIIQVIVSFRRAVLSHVRSTRYYHGFVSEEDGEAEVRMTFMTASKHRFCRWLLMFGSSASIEHPVAVRDDMAALVDELAAHYRALAWSESDAR